MYILITESLMYLGRTSATMYIPCAFKHNDWYSVIQPPCTTTRCRRRGKVCLVTHSKQRDTIRGPAQSLSCFTVRSSRSRQSHPPCIRCWGPSGWVEVAAASCCSIAVLSRCRSQQKERVASVVRFQPRHTCIVLPKARLRTGGLNQQGATSRPSEPSLS